MFDGRFRSLHITLRIQQELQLFQAGWFRLVFLGFGLGIPIQCRFGEFDRLTDFPCQGLVLDIGLVQYADRLLGSGGFQGIGCGSQGFAVAGDCQLVFLAHANQDQAFDLAFGQKVDGQNLSGFAFRVIALEQSCNDSAQGFVDSAGGGP